MAKTHAEPQEVKPNVRRGTYDRGASASARAQQQRERLLSAVLELHSLAKDGRLTVDAIVKATGSGRNTFYGHFGDVHEIMAAASAAAVVYLQQSLNLGHSAIGGAPLEALLEGAQSWFNAVELRPEEVHYLLGCNRPALVTSFRAHLAARVEVGVRAGVLAHADDELRLACVHAAALELTERLLNGADRLACARLFADVAASVLR